MKAAGGHGAEPARRRGQMAAGPWEARQARVRREGATLLPETDRALADLAAAPARRRGRSRRKTARSSGKEGQRAVPRQTAARGRFGSVRSPARPSGIDPSGRGTDPGAHPGGLAEPRAGMTARPAGGQVRRAPCLFFPNPRPPKAGNFHSRYPKRLPYNQQRGTWFHAVATMSDNEAKLYQLIVYYSILCTTVYIIKNISRPSAEGG
jgi:hypothetical protein